ncbi:lipase [Novosphingobium sp. PC22D]|uniref:alpha/beta hydrolase n=1 Tax=Novosphingobium sp. PC22D TaxID=1962403 RepID=UPI000BF04AA7|nr:alpha/beta hydrolase [Novosphingobium sp. PC22D]PEQ10614.1 lipase [Novosphingobium sp. PC22D]
MPGISPGRFAAACAALALAGAGLGAQAPVLAQAAVAAQDKAAPFVRPDTAAYLEAFNARTVPPLTRDVLEQLHKLPPEAMAAMAQQDLPVGEMAVEKDLEMAGPGGPIRLKLFDVRAERKPGPVMVFYHGGGYVLGSIVTHAGLAAEISRRLDLPVVSVEYRLAPENPFPAAIDDGEAAARWVAANGAALGLEVTGLVLAGDSAGGNLALVTAAALRDASAAVPVVLQLPIYPATDFAGIYPSQEAFAKGYALDATTMALMTEHYAADPKDPRASPILGDLSGLPPTVLVTASLDPLRDQGRAYGAKLIEAGVPVAFYEAKGLIHGFATYRKAIPSAQAETEAFLALARTMLDEVSAKKIDTIVSK